ncbi:MAG TPA: hypothetical protein ENN85_03440 [Methanoculleus sp.]|nr:hypothetical protein [Methanoculleus sp.]
MNNARMLPRVLLLSLSLVVIVHALGSSTWFAGPAVLLALLAVQARPAPSTERSYASLAIGEILVIIVGLSSIPLALLAQILVLMLAGVNFQLVRPGRIYADMLVSTFTGITAGIVVLALDDVYLILLVILCAVLSMLVFVLFNEKRIMRIAGRIHA